MYDVPSLCTCRSSLATVLIMLINDSSCVVFLIVWCCRPKCANHVHLLISHWVHEKILVSAFSWLAQKKSWTTSFDFQSRIEDFPDSSMMGSQSGLLLVDFPKIVLSYCQYGGAMRFISCRIEKSRDYVVFLIMMNLLIMMIPLIMMK